MLTLFITSCENDGGESKVDLIEGVVPNFQIPEEAVKLADFNNISAGEDFDFVFDVSIGFGELTTKGDIVGVYTRVDDPITESINEAEIFSTILIEDANFPQQVRMSFFDLIDKFEGLSVDDIGLGDNLLISAQFVSEDGLEFKIIDEMGSFVVGLDIRNNPLSVPFLAYPVSCPTKLEGSYTANIKNVSGAALSDFPNNGQTVEVTQPSSGSYVVSDATANILGVELQLGFTDVCGILTVSGPSLNFPNQIIFDDLGAVLNVSTGIITLNIAFNSGSCCQVGTSYTLELVPAN